MACINRRWEIFVGVALLLATASGCASILPAPEDMGQGQASAKLTGTVTCRVRVVLPPDAYVLVELVDISRRDAPARIIAIQEILLQGRQVPIPFEIAYGPATIDPSHTYAVQARILAGQRMLFVNTYTYKVLTNGVRSNVEVVIEPIHGSGY